MSENRFGTPWISESGNVTPEEGRKIADTYLKKHPESRYISYHTDRFSAGSASSVLEEIDDRLLEIRVFDETAELKFFRTSPAADFQYRIADDEVLKANLDSLQTDDAFLKDPAHYRHPVRQVLDIDATSPAYRNGRRDERGCRLLRTTGGGNYALPLEGDENVALVIDYLSYDEKTGVCSAVDDRIAGFEKWEGGKENG